MFRADAVFASGNRALVPRVVLRCAEARNTAGECPGRLGAVDRSMAQETNVVDPRPAYAVRLGQSVS